MKLARKKRLDRDWQAAVPGKRSIRRAQRILDILEDERRRLEDGYLGSAEWADDKDRLVKVQQELEISREIYSQLYDFAPVGYATLSRAGWLREINLTAAKTLG